MANEYELDVSDLICSIFSLTACLTSLIFIYEKVEDFAEHDDFFESKPLHDLEDIMLNYSVVMSFTGSRFYVTIVEPDDTFNEIFPQDYHVSLCLTTCFQFCVSA